MHLDDSKSFAIGTGLLLLLLPVILWLLLSLADRRSLLNPGHALSWIRKVHWLAWICGAGLLAYCFFLQNSRLLICAVGLTGMSSGLGLLERWLKNHPLPD